MTEVEMLFKMIESQNDKIETHGTKIENKLDNILKDVQSLKLDIEIVKRDLPASSSKRRDFTIASAGGGFATFVIGLIVALIDYFRKV